MVHSTYIQVDPNRMIFDPTNEAAHIGYREISGTLTSSGETVQLRAWALVYFNRKSGQNMYRLAVERFGEVGGDGFATWQLVDFHADTFGNMSERNDLIGENSTVWVTSTVGSDEARGGILVAVNDSLLHILCLNPYLATGHERAVHVLERISHAMSNRISEIELEPKNATMARLPIATDLAGILGNVVIGKNSYRTRPAPA